jgi:hypothetical protein
MLAYEVRTMAKALEPGARVRLLAPTWGLTLASNTGTVVGAAEDEDYYVVHLDAPARYDRGLGDPPEVLPDVCELIDNLEAL